MTADPPHMVRVTRRFEAPPDRVFDAWLDPALIGKWMFGPALRDEEVLRIAVDPRVGGSFSFMVRRQGQEIDHVGEYRLIDRPHRLVFTWGIAGGGGGSDDESLVTIDIAPLRAGVGGVGGCELTLTHRLDAKWAAYVPRVEDGWSKMLAALGALLGRGTAPPRDAAGSAGRKQEAPKQ